MCSHVIELKTSQTHSSYFRRALELSTKGTLTEREILNIKSVLGGHKRTTLTPTERQELFDYHFGYGCYMWGITKEQTTKGIKWLRRNLKRKVCKDALGAYEAYIIERFSHFTFEGFRDMSSTVCRQMGYMHLAPVYRVWSHDGEYFDYTYYGGELEVVDVG